MSIQTQQPVTDLTQVTYDQIVSMLDNIAEGDYSKHHPLPAILPHLNVKKNDHDRAILSYVICIIAAFPEDDPSLVTPVSNATMLALCKKQFGDVFASVPFDCAMFLLGTAPTFREVF